MKDQLDALSARFRARCALDRESLLAAVAANDARTTRHLAHKLAGAAGTFGCPELSRAAIALDDQMADGAGADPALVAALDVELQGVSAA